MHQKSDMVCIKARESTLTAEVPNDEFHQWRIGLLQKPEREYPAELPQISRPDVRFIICSILLLSLIPLLTYVWYPGCLRNGLWCQGEVQSSKVYMTITQM